MRIAVITCLNDRPEISQIFMNSLGRIAAADIYPWHVYAAVSSLTDFDLCSKYGVNPIMVSGTIAGDKWNVVLSHALKKSEATHFLILADDDSMSVYGIILLLENSKCGNSYVGFKKNYFVDTLTGKAHVHEQQYQANKLCGAGCLISRKAIMDACDMVEINVIITIETPAKTWLPGKHIVSRSVGEYLEGYKGYARIIGGQWHNLWPSKGNGLDHAREMRLVMAGHPPVAVDDDRVHVTDFKSEKNIWSYEAVREKFHGPESTIEEAMWFMSEPEKDYVRSLIKSRQ